MASPLCLCKGLGESLFLFLQGHQSYVMKVPPLSPHIIYITSLLGLPLISAGGCGGKDTTQSVRVDKEIWKRRLRGSLCLGGRGKGSAQRETWGRLGMSSGFLLCLALTS